MPWSHFKYRRKQHFFLNKIFYGLIVLYDDLGVIPCVNLVCLLYVSLVASLAIAGSDCVFLHKIYDAS